MWTIILTIAFVVIVNLAIVSLVHINPMDDSE